PLGGRGENVPAGPVILVQRVVQAREHARAVLERGMRGDVLHSLAVDPHLAPVVEARQEFLARVGKRRHGASSRQAPSAGNTSSVKRSSCACWSSPMKRTQRSVAPAAAYRRRDSITTSFGPRPIVPRECTPPP